MYKSSWLRYFAMYTTYIQITTDGKIKRNNTTKKNDFLYTLNKLIAK